MNQIDEMRELIDKLNYYTKLYDEGQPQISDRTWDDLYFKLQEIEKETGIILSNSPTHHIDYQVVNNLKKVTHSHEMLSLDKTKSEEEIVSFLKGHDSIAMCKMDGLTCSLFYENGKLVRGETRGNGIVGEDITHNIFFVKGVPTELPIKENLTIDGEIICTYEDFKDFETDYKNPRNFASGSIRLLDSRASAQRRLTFVAWDCIEGINCETLSEKLVKLNDLGFIMVPYVIIPSKMCDLEKIKHSILLIKENAKEFDYPIDGVVFKYDNCAYYSSLGSTAHHAKGGKAFKFYDEEYETVLRSIEWSMGKTGQLTPVAIFDPVDDGESVVERASLHNLNIMKQVLGDFPHKGQKIWICKQNMIIPQVVRSIPDCYLMPGEEPFDKILLLPEKCPVCGEPVYREDDFLYCGNPNCEGKFLNLLKHFVGKKGLDIKGLSEATLQKLIDWGWVGNYQELFSLSNFRNEWVAKQGFGPKSVDNILNAIEASRTCELWQFISALSIPLIGSTYAKEIAKREPTWNDFIKDIEDKFDFTTWLNFGYEMYDSLHKFDYTEANILANQILNLQNNLIASSQNEAESSIKGLTFVITGKLSNRFKNRDEIVQLIESNGGKVVSSVSKKTNYLVNNDINSTSSKNVKAQQLNIPIISEEQLLTMINEGTV